MDEMSTYKAAIVRYEDRPQRVVVKELSERFVSTDAAKSSAEQLIVELKLPPEELLRFSIEVLDENDRLIAFKRISIPRLEKALIEEGLAIAAAETALLAALKATQARISASSSGFNKDVMVLEHRKKDVSNLVRRTLEVTSLNRLGL